MDAIGDETEPWLTPLQLEAWITLLALIEIVPPAIEGQLKADGGINLFEYQILAMLSEEPKRTLQMSRLAEIICGSISRLSHAVGRLQQRGWVDKQAGRAGQRHNTVSLTDEGRNAITTLAVDHVSTVRRVLAAPLTEDETRAFVTIAGKVIGAASPEQLELLQRRIPEIIGRNVAGGTQSRT